MKHIKFLFVVLLISCSGSQKKPVEIEEVSLGVAELADYPKYLSEWGLFRSPMNELVPNGENVFPYEINAALFSDYAYKARFIKLPNDKVMDYHNEEVFQFPVGSILVKNFFYPKSFKKPNLGRRVIETRLLIHEEKGWKAIVYQWDEQQEDAKRVILGKKVPVEWTDDQGTLQRINYSIPSQPQCKSCHDFNGKMTPIGPSARQLNRDNQLSKWEDKGFLKKNSAEQYPRLVDYMDEAQPLDLRARAWLETNCAHCHRKEGPAKNSGLYLLASQPDPYRLGVNKPPIAAGKGSGGLKYGIVPGDPGSSILVHRIESLEPGEMMPELGRKMTHQEGVALIRDWIAEM